LVLKARKGGPKVIVDVPATPPRPPRPPRYLS
jgi:hypothetical protein